MIIGDSYGGIGRKNNFFTEGFNFSIHVTDNSREDYRVVWTDLLQDHYDCAMTICSYGGKSWWFSYCMFEKWKALNPIEWNETDAVILLHTLWGRFNSSNRLIPGHSSMGPARHTTDNEQYEAKKIVEVLEQYEAVLYDDQFYKWCQTQYFSILPTVFCGKKVINFACFGQVVNLEDFLKIKIGTIIDLDLGAISFGELNTKKQPVFLKDPRAGHFSEENHRVLSSQLIRLLDDYQEGVVHMPLSLFKQGFLDPF